MAETIINIAHMIAHGAKGIRLNSKRDYGRYISSNQNNITAARWLSIGERLRDSLNKVASKNGKI